MAEIRLAKIEDLGRLKQLFRDTILRTGKLHYSEAQLKAWSNRADRDQRWLDLINSQYTLLIEEKEELLGFASLKGADYFDFLYVAHSQQGKGYAKALYQAILAEAKKRGATQIYSDVSYMARPFFLAQGFTLLKSNENKLEGEILINFKVVKEL